MPGRLRTASRLSLIHIYLLDALRYSKCEKMVLEINGPLSPVKILPENGKDFIYLVLPVRFKNEG